MFRNTKLMTLLAAGLVLFACQKERTEDAALVSGNYLTFTATIDGIETRTSVDGTKISWNPAEEINIFYGASEGSKFVSQNTEPSQSVTFSGTLTAFTGTTEAGEPNSFWAIYPYDESNTSSGSSVTAYLPENQVGVPNNVPDKALMMVAKASGLALSFKQVCARIKVNVTTPGIRKIEIRGNNDETIAGSAVISMNSQGLPEWQDAGTGAGKVIELVPESGTTFEEAEYSIPILPQTFSAGFTMTCYKSDVMGSYSTGAVTFGRNQVRTVSTGRVTEWTVLEEPPILVDGDFSDWDKLDPSRIAVTACDPDAIHSALTLAKVYADEEFVYVYFEWDKDQITHNTYGEQVPLEIFLNGDGDLSTGGFADMFSDAGFEVMVEGYIYPDGISIGSFDPIVYPWVGETNAFGWDWGDPLLEEGSGFCAGAGSEGKYELSIRRDLYPLGELADNFSVGLAILQYWDAVGVLPNAAVTESNPSGHAPSLWVQTIPSSSVPVPKIIDMGLPSGVKWASFNLGASKPEEYGDYYAWGETEPYYSSQDPLTWKEGKEEGYYWPSYKWCMGTGETITKYCSSESFGSDHFVDDRMTLEQSDDAVQVNLGGKWRMPTDGEWTELMENCIWTWTQENGVNGYRITSNTSGQSIFLPATGFYQDTYHLSAGSFGHYWSSSLYDFYPDRAWCVCFWKDDVQRSPNYFRNFGLTIRPVFAE